MSTTQRQTSSGSTTSVGGQRHEGMDERKRKRMLSNRDSARRSRMRKQKMVEDLTNEIIRLQSNNNDIVGKIEETTKGYMVFAAENNVLRAQAVELTERYRSWMSFLTISGLDLDMDIPPDPLLKPWHHLCASSQPILASSEFFQS